MLLGIISDIHEDIKGLEKALKILERKGCSEVICLGDITGYSSPHYKFFKTRDARACVRLVRSTCSIIIPGNHDLFAARKVPASNPGFSYGENWYQKDFEERQKLAAGRIWLYEDTELPGNLMDEDKDFIRSLPEYQIKKYQNKKVLFSHHLYPDLTGSSTRLLPDEGLHQSHLNFMSDNSCDISFFGHNHIDGFWRIGKDDSHFARVINFQDNNPVALGVPCIAKGANKPGYTLIDFTNGIAVSYPLYRWLTGFKLY